jgi:hypothetical protein
MAPDVGDAMFAAGMAARLGMAVIFAQSGWHGLRDVARFAGVVANYRILPAALVPGAAVAMPALSLAASLLLVVAPVAGVVLGLGLMAVFTGAVWINLARGRGHIDCGCGGADGQRISGGLVVRNVVLLGLLGGALLAPGNGRLGFAAVVLAVGGGGALAALYFAASQLLANQGAARASVVA